MVLWIASPRWAWVKYPVYEYDEKEDNRDNDPTEPRNTTMSLQQELAACQEKTIVSEADPLPPPPPPPPPEWAVYDDLDKISRRPKAQTGGKFLKKLALAKALEGEKRRRNLRNCPDASSSGPGSAGVSQPTNDKQQPIKNDNPTKNKKKKKDPLPSNELKTVSTTPRLELTGVFQFADGVGTIDFSFSPEHISLAQWIAMHPYKQWETEENGTDDFSGEELIEADGFGETIHLSGIATG